MGWASGSSLLMSVWTRVRPHVSPEKRAEVLLSLMHVFASEDCDTLNEVVCSRWPESEEAYEKWLASS